MRLLAGALLVMASGACVSLMLGRPATVIEEHDNVKVRIYRSDRGCRIDIVTATDTIQTGVTRCVHVPTTR